MKLLILFYSEVVRFINMVKRYLFNYLSAILIFFILFLLMFFGISTFAKDSISGSSLDSLVLGYVLWSMAMFSFQSIASTIWAESQKGTLEKLYLTGIGVKKILFARVLTQIIYNFIMSVFILILSMLITGRWLSINIIYATAMIFISILSLVGIGFIAGGLALLYKKVMSLFQIFSFGIAGLMALSTFPLNIFSFLPYIPGAKTLIGVVISGKTYPIWWYGFILLNSLIYLIVGMIIFDLFNKKARSLNKLGQY